MGQSQPPEKVGPQRPPPDTVMSHGRPHRELWRRSSLGREAAPERSTD